MKVCMISGAFPAMKCGIGDYSARLVGRLADEGVEVDVLTCRSPLVRPADHPAVTVFPMLSAAPGLDARMIARHARQHHCDVIHIQYPTWPFRRSLSVSFLPGLLKLLGGGPVAVTFHEVSRCHPINRLRHIPIAYAARAVAATTPEDCRWLARKLPGIAGRVVYIPIGANVEPSDDVVGRRSDYDRRAHRRSMGIAEGEVAACHFGFTLRNKLIEDTLAAFRRVIDAGEKARLVLMSGLARSEGSYGAEMLDLIDKLRLGGHIVQTGFLPQQEVSRCLKACDFATLLFRDGVSFRRGSILAVMAHGLPVVSCHTGPVPYGLRDGENVLLSRTGDIDGISENMRRLCRDADLRLKLSRASLKTAEGFSWPKIAGRTVELYRTMLC